MKVFIGSSNEVSNGLLPQVATIVEQCKIIPMTWNDPDVFIAANYTLETLEEWATKVDAAIFICSADDKTWYRGKELGTPRDNVIFEHGLFLGKLGRKKSIIVKYGDVTLPNDVEGVTYVDFSEGKQAQGILSLKTTLQKLKEIQSKDKLEHFLSMDEDVLRNDKFQVDYNDLFTDDELNRINDSRKTPEEQFRTIDKIWTTQVISLKNDYQRLMFIYEKLVFLSYFPYKGGEYAEWLQTATNAIQKKELLEYKIINLIKEYIEAKMQKAGDGEFYKNIADELYKIKEKLSEKNNPLIEIYLNDYLGLACRLSAIKFKQEGHTEETTKYLERSIEAFKRCEEIEDNVHYEASRLWAGYSVYNIARTYMLQEDAKSFERYMKKAHSIRENWLKMELINDKIPRVFEHAFKAEFLLSIDCAIKQNISDIAQNAEVISESKKIYESLKFIKIPPIAIVEDVIKKFEGLWS